MPEKVQPTPDTPDVRPGDTVRVHVVVRETKIDPKTRKPQEKKRTQQYEGTVIRVKGGGVYRSITVRKLSSGVGVERIFPLVSSAVEKIDIMKRGKVRRSRLYYLRGRVGRAARVKEKK